MKLRAHFSWTAPRDLFFLYPKEGGPREICKLIRADAEQTLSDRPGLEALEDYYNLSGATEFLVDGKILPLHGHEEDEPGDDLYQLDVTVEGELHGSKSWRELALYNRCELWDEIYKRGDISGEGASFRVRVKHIG